jgi:acyl-phosphate glycerol 3-phosphate acyltransferase
MLLPHAVIAIIGYLLGALPFGYLVARAKGVNIFEVGSKNPGATNVRRVLGAGPGNLVFALDALKGAAAAAWALLSFTTTTVNYTIDETPLAEAGSVTGSAWVALGVTGLIAALVGHSFSCFTKFRGGKGVATSMGGLIVLMPLATLIAAAVWVAVFFASRYVSLASIVAAVVLVLAAYVLKLPGVLVGVAAAVAGFVILRHRANIVRLLNGTENRFVKKNTSKS